MKSSEYSEKTQNLVSSEFPRNIPTEFRGKINPSEYSYGIPRKNSVLKKKGRLVGLGRRSRSAAPFSAPPPFVDPEVLTTQLKEKDDHISLLEIQMAAQQAGYEAQKRLNEQMMEMMKRRMYPNEVFPNVQDP
ncbi:hypothetical protein IGI04_001899 [Brassica rapa subsp. trilocularis]|uniref:MYB-CC type transcription factor LHEQLE-containing domain-containing protein n=1 Tax=Brassica rapa subsp. trilocularis TaxID=1813537 RepID=A0ABQ7NTZ3_BRACM|nr:hypothetical protein IGI04_001899 [Brassica rapa subsp. trilocularis]